MPVDTSGVREVLNTWIPLSDGVKLATRLWLPPDHEPAPAILEYLPYRKDDGTARRDALHHPYFAAHGYACVRVDMRGSGDSDGILLDEYLPLEQDDALEILTWIADQPWCSGSVGIMGISWGGFNALQIAARRPPQLKAIISVCSTDDRYADDVHYTGGCLLDRNLGWATTMLAYNARPPDPLHVGDRWRSLWLDRLERTPPWIDAWLTHQRYDEFWKHGSVCEDFTAITCAVYMVGGWADGYPNAIPRTLAGLSCPCKGLIGPWGHQYPQLGVPGPKIGFLQECLRWWDYWLKGAATGVMDEPMLRAWIQDSAPPRSFLTERPGRWVAEPAWPASSTDSLRLMLNASGSMSRDLMPEQRLDILGAQYAGMYSGSRTTFGRPGDFPPDQRAEDGLSLTFTSEPLSERLELLGYPSVTLALSVDRPLALIAVRLCEVAPDGASSMISRGLLNLSHRQSREQPSPMVPGAREVVTLQLDVLGCAIPAGHRLRVAISPTYWPYVWPSPEPVTLSVFTGAESYVELPVRPPHPDDGALRPFEAPETASPLAIEVMRPPASSRAITHELTTGVVDESLTADDGRWRQIANDLVYESKTTTRFRIAEGDPLSAHIRCERTFQIGRGDWQTRVEVWSEQRSDLERFYVDSSCEAFIGTECVFSRRWTFQVPRDHV
ncbi:MAG TPA: CocE/NonD family hydrolase [Chloroflexota bacterium]